MQKTSPKSHKSIFGGRLLNCMGILSSCYHWYQEIWKMYERQHFWKILSQILKQNCEKHSWFDPILDRHPKPYGLPNDFYISCKTYNITIWYSEYFTIYSIYIINAWLYKYYKQIKYFNGLGAYLFSDNYAFIWMRTSSKTRLLYFQPSPKYTYNIYREWRN